MALSLRVGYQCSNFYRSEILPSGLIFDDNYKASRRDDLGTYIYIDRLTWCFVFSTHLLDVPFMSVIIEPEVNSLLHFYFLQHTTTSISFNFIPRSHKDKHTIIFCTRGHFICCKVAVNHFWCYGRMA